MKKKKQQIERVERALLAAECPVAEPTDEWQRQLMTEVRRVARPEPEIFEFRAMRFALVTAAAALLALCFGVWFYETNLMDLMTVDVAGGLAQVVGGI